MITPEIKDKILHLNKLKLKPIIIADRLKKYKITAKQIRDVIYRSKKESNNMKEGCKLYKITYNKYLKGFNMLETKVKSKTQNKNLNSELTSEFSYQLDNGELIGTSGSNGWSSTKEGAYQLYNQYLLGRKEELSNMKEVIYNQELEIEEHLRILSHNWNSDWGKE